MRQDGSFKEGFPAAFRLWIWFRKWCPAGYLPYCRHRDGDGTEALGLFTMPRRRKSLKKSKRPEESQFLRILRGRWIRHVWLQAFTDLTAAIYNTVSGAPWNCRPYSGSFLDDMANREHFPAGHGSGWCALLQRRWDEVFSVCPVRWFKPGRRDEQSGTEILSQARYPFLRYGKENEIIVRTTPVDEAVFLRIRFMNRIAWRGENIFAKHIFKLRTTTTGCVLNWKTRKDGWPGQSLLRCKAVCFGHQVLKNHPCRQPALMDILKNSIWQRH